MKHFNRILPITFVLMLTGVFFSCEEDPEPDPFENFEREKEYDDEDMQGKIVISEDYVPIDWEQPSSKVISGNESTGHFELELDKAVSSKITNGSLITIDVDSAIYLRKVKSAKINGDKVILETKQGSLGDLLEGSEFEIVLSDPDAIQPAEDAVCIDDIQDDEEYTYEYDDDESSSAPATRAIVEEKKKELPKLYPSEIRYKDENGNWVKKSMKDVESKTRGGGSWTFVDWNTTGTIALGPKGEPVSKNSDVKFSGGFQLTLNVNFNVTGSISIKGVKGTNEGKNDKDSEEEEDGIISAYTSGKLRVTPALTFGVTVDWDADAYFNLENTIPMKLVKLGEVTLGHIIVPLVPPLAIDITPTADVTVQPELTISGGVQFGMHGKHELTTKIGFEFNSKDNSFTNKSEAPSITNTWPEEPYLAVTGSARLNSPVSSGLSMKLFTVAGPKMSFVSNFFLDFTAAKSTEVDGWLSKASLGMSYGAKAGFDYKIDEVSSPVWKLGKEKTIFEHPYAIECLTDLDDIIDGVDNELSFQVYDKFMGAHVKTFFPFTKLPCDIYVKAGDNDYVYMPDGTLCPGGSRIRIPTTDGKVKFKWRPYNKKSVLDARLYGPPSTIVSQVSVLPSNCPNGIKWVDMGTGILWANMNVGANSPKEKGGYYGWGDATGKNTWQSYKQDYGSYKEAKNVGQYYGGKVPILDISGTENDIARMQWGGSCRMPTIKEWEELIANCTWSYDEYSKMVMFLAKNGNTIELPAAGYRIGDTFFSFNNNGKLNYTCEYWSSTLAPKGSKLNWQTTRFAYYMGIDPNKQKVYMNDVSRYYGQSVRPVRDK